MLQAVAGTVMVQVRPPGLAVTVYEAAAPPDPAATVMVAWASPATAVGAGGAPGARRNVPLVITRLPVPEFETATKIPFA